MVWSGVEGTTMDFCRVKTVAQTDISTGSGRRLHTGTKALTYVDPGVVHKLCDGHSLIRVCLQEPVDQALGCKE